ncbi:MAG TPA: UDP-N-acetylmuramoyl-tripeptide--D-alanyl-D-alanine ligase [Ornithinibacter sp.]|nr:UDP-N-acetylmuramoyl-tripeptide--D-alanyl-D-alanine ligase [Ornithinibacter sp.]
MASVPPRQDRPPRALLDLVADLAPLRGELRTGRAVVDASIAVRRVEPDLGRMRAGDLFVALPGASVDGHDLVALAAMRGASAALVARPWADRLGALPLPLVVVDDPAVAVSGLASAWRARLRGTVVGITGSVGKTSTKEALAAALRPTRATWATEANRNTGLGVAMTLLDAAETDDVVVLEIGGGEGRDEIARTCAVARPDVGVVTSVHPVHLATMGSVAAIAASKADLVRAVPREGAVVLNADDPLVRDMALLSSAPVRWYGRGPAADVGAESVRSAGLDGTDLVVRSRGLRHLVHVPFLGGHAVEVVLAAVAAAEVLGVEASEAIAGIPDAGPLVRPRLVPGEGGCTVVDDCYSASPPSVRSALDLVGALVGRRRVAVLGDMRELGELTGPSHHEVGRYAAHRLDRLVTVGEDARELARAASDERPGVRVTSVGEDELDGALAAVRAELDGTAVVLVKGSRALRLDRVVDALRL